MTAKFLLLVIALFLFTEKIYAQNSSLQQKIAHICQSKHAVVGVAIMNLETGDTLTYNGEKHFPMQSVFKLPLALAILSKVDNGIFSLDQSVFISKNDLLPNTWSPLREKYPDGNIHLPLSELLQYTVAQSDNNGCDILFGLIGGTGKVNTCIRQLRIKNIVIAATEVEMHKEWNVQFSNWATPYAMVKLLDIFYKGHILSPKSRKFLLKTMENTVTGTDKIKGLLPPGTIVAHKTGSSDRNAKGIKAADNDAGIVTLPNGRHFAIVVFITHSTESDKTNARIIAEISRVVWDYFISKS